MPIVSEEEKNTCKAIVREGLNAKITCVARSVRKDIDAALDCDSDGVRITVPTGEPLRRYKVRKSKEEILEIGLEAIQYAKDHGAYVIYSATDAPRTDLNFLKKFFSTAIKAGVDRIRIADPAGSLAPHAAYILVQEVAKVARNVPIELHFHDDFGLATANSLMGVCAGAKWISSTVNGLGEKAGNAATEEVALGLRLLYDIDVHMKFEKFYEISHMIEKLSGIDLSPGKAIVGRNIFVHESGDLIVGVLRNPYTYYSFLPGLVGQQRRIVVGKKSGRDSLKAKLAELGINVSEEQLPNILTLVKEKAQEKKAVLSDEELMTIFRDAKQSASQHQ